MKSTPLEYRDYEIWPIDIMQFRFEFNHKDYDGPEDRRLGTGKTIEDCRQQIDEQIEDAKCSR